MDQDQVVQDWKKRGFSCDVWVDSPGQVWADYTHDVDELLMVIDGEVELEMHGKRIRPKVGEEVLIPAGETHTVRNIGSIRSHWLYGYKNV